MGVPLQAMLGGSGMLEAPGTLRFQVTQHIMGEQPPPCHIPLDHSPHHPQLHPHPTSRQSHH